MKDRESFYQKLKIQLDDTTVFPGDYLFKFIVTSEAEKVEQVQALFDNKGALITTKKSNTGKYISVSIVIKIEKSDDVISYYKQAETIEGIISL